MSKSTPIFRAGLVTALFILIASGCATLDYTGTAGNIIGSWKFKNDQNGPQTLTFKRGGVYELDTDGNGSKDIWGSYRLSRDWLILNDVGGDFAYDCGQEGAYLYRVSPNNEEITFTLMADQCPPRTKAMSVEWSRIHKHPPKPLMIKI